MSTWGNGPVQVRLTVEQSVIDSYILSFTHHASCCDSDIGFGTLCSATIKATIYGQLSLAGKTVFVELGGVESGSLIWHPLGNFFVNECQVGEDSTTISAQDAAWYATSVQYTPTITGAATVSDVLEDVADQCGLDVEQTTLNLGLSITVTGTLTDHTCRAMLGYLAALCGCNCVISRAGKIRFVWFADSGETIDPDRTYAGAHTFGGVSTLLGLKCTVPDGDSEVVLTAGNADKAVEVVCPLMTQSRLNALWDTLGGYQYPVLEVSCYGGAEVLPGDLVTVTDLAGNSLNVPVMEVSLSVDGGCRCTLRSYGKGDTSRSCDSIGPRELRLREVEQTAGFAMQSANGKNKNFYQASAPTTADGLTPGDLWFDTANGNRMSEWTGTAWSAFTLQDAAISNLDAGAITSGKLSANFIGAGTISANTLQIVTNYYTLQVSEEATDEYGLKFFTGNDPEDALAACMSLLGSSASFGAGNDVAIYSNRGALTLYSGGAGVTVDGQIGLIDIEGDLNVGGKVTEGNGSTATGNYSHAEGKSTTASGSNSHAEGASTTASGGNAHAEGGSTTASNWDSHAEGSETTASGDKSHAEGKGSVASGARSHAGGYYTIANGANQTAIGAYNIADTSSLFIIGNGTANNSRSNAMTVDGSGNVNISGQFKRHGNDFIILRAYNFTASCTAGNRNDTGSGSVSVSGYTPLGIVGFEVYGSNCSYVWVYRCNLNGNTAHWHIRNNGVYNFSGNIYLQVLYIAN